MKVKRIKDWRLLPVASGRPPIEGNEMDIRKMIGMTVDEAREKSGATIRAIIQDGEKMIRTMDFQPGRINVETVEGKITRIISLG